MKKSLLAFGLGAIATLSSYTAHAQFAMGADVSWLQQSEALGHKFYDINGKQKDALVILKEKGVNSIRLRTWVNPDMNNPFSGHCSQKETIAMAVRCKNLGLRVMIDFHYNDTWTSVGSQETPKAWQSMTYTQMKTALYDYAYNFCVAMKSAGVTPEWFQNGNETNKGIVNPTGSLSKPTQMTGLLNQGYDAIKKVFPNTKVLIHTAQPQKDEGKTMIDTYIKNGGKLDAIGLSSYASQGSSQTGVQNGVQSYYDKFGLEVIMVEIGGTSKQAALIKDWAEDNAAMNKPCKGGIFYWEPTASDSPFNWNDAIFDESQKATSALDGFLTKISTTGCPTVVTGVEDEPVAQEANNYTSFYPNPFSNSLTIQRNGAFGYAIYDITGLMVEEGNGEGSVSVGKGIATGMYMVKIQADGKTSYIKVQKD